MTTFKSFTAPFDTRYDPIASEILGKDHWRILTSFRYYLGEKFSNRWVYVPAGYLTDGASVPKLFQNVISPFGPHGQAAAVHDILCEYLSFTQDGLPARCTRKFANDVFMEAMKVLNTPVANSLIAYVAVEGYRIFANAEQPSNTAVKRRLEAEWPDTIELALRRR